MVSLYFSGVSIYGEKGNPKKVHVPMTEIIYSLVLGSPFPPIPGLFLDIKQKLLSEESRTLTKITTRCGVS